MNEVPSTSLRVLVVEDNRVMSDVMRFNFSRAGFDVSVAANGRAAWESLQAGGFHLLVTDFQMPEMDGGELCRRIRSESRFSDLRIILLTAKGLELDRERMMRDLRVNLILHKPFSPRQLVAAAEELTDEARSAACPVAQCT